MPSLAETIAALRRQRRPTAANHGPSRMRAVEAFGSNPGALKAFIHRPPVLPPRAPLVVVLHGCTQTAESYAESAGWLELADEHGFVVLSPEQQRANNPNLCFNWFQRADVSRDAGEAASIAQMVRHVVETEALDPARVFITGLSAGGAMSAAMLAAYPELFAAGTVIAGLPYAAATSMQGAFAAMSQPPARTSREWGDLVRSAAAPSGPWPRISIWHGDADQIVRPGAGDALVQQWTNVHGVEKQTRETSIDGRRHRTIWRSALGEAVVEFNSVAGMDHGAPLATEGHSACGAAAPYVLDVGISSTFESLRNWGLLDETVATGHEDVPDWTHEAARQHQKRTSAAAGLPKIDVNAIITSALRSAGLMK